MASIVWNSICEIFSTLVRPTTRKTRVTFTPSTLKREILREVRLAATPNPFLNFFAEVRIKAMQESQNHPKHLARLAKTAGHMWNDMSEEQKRPYREMALEQKVKKSRRKRRSALFTPQRKLQKNRGKRKQDLLAKEKEKKNGA